MKHYIVTLVTVLVLGVAMNADANMTIGEYGNSQDGPSYEQFDTPDNNPGQGGSEPADPAEPPQGEPLPEDYDPQQGGDNAQSNILGGNYNGSHVQGGTFVQGDSVNNSSTRVINPRVYQGYVGQTPLVASPGTCFGSRSQAISAPGFGYTRNKTMIDKHCNERNNVIMQQNNMRANAEILKQMGLQQAAMTMMCQQDRAVRQALKSSLSPDQYIMVCGTQGEKLALREQREHDELVAMLSKPAVEPTPAPKPVETHKFHTVVQGDTLWRISGGSQAGYQRILELNPELTPNTIEVGQTIRIN